jgi:hypothetical protein
MGFLVKHYERETATTVSDRSVPMCQGNRLASLSLTNPYRGFSMGEPELEEEKEDRQ